MSEPKNRKNRYDHLTLDEKVNYLLLKSDYNSLIITALAGLASGDEDLSKAISIVAEEVADEIEAFRIEHNIELINIS